MGPTNILKEFVALIWHYPFATCCFLVLFTPPFHPVLLFFSPLLISTALFIVAILTMGPHLREYCSVEDEEEEQLRFRNSQAAMKPEVWEDKTVQLQLIDTHLVLEEGSQDHTWEPLITKTVPPAYNSQAPYSKDSSGKTSKWKELRRIYRDKGIAWLDNLFRNENWKGAGLNDENVSILQEAFPQRQEEGEEEEESHVYTLVEKSKDKSLSTSAPGKQLPEVVVLSDHRELRLGLSKDVEFAAEKQHVLFADGAPALEDYQDDASSPTLAVSINPHKLLPAMAIGDGGDEEEEQFVEGYEEEEEEEEEFEEAPENLITAAALLQVSEIPAAPLLLLEQPHEDDPATLPTKSSATHEEQITRSLHDKDNKILAPVSFAEVMHEESVLASTGKEHPEAERDDISEGEISCDGVRKFDPVLDEAGSPPPHRIEDEISSPLVLSVIHGDSTEPQDSSLWSTERGSDDNVHQDCKSSSATHQERCNIPINEIGKEIDQERATLATDTVGIFEELGCVPVAMERAYEVPLNTEPGSSLPATELCCEERSAPVSEIREEMSHVIPACEFDEEEVHHEESISPVSGAADDTNKSTDEEIQFVEGRLDRLPSTKHSLSASEIHMGKPCLVEELLSSPSSQAWERPPAPATDTLQQRSGDIISSREISVEGASPVIVAHNPEDKLIAVATVIEEDGSRVPSSPKHEEESAPVATEFCLDAAAGSQVHTGLQAVEEKTMCNMPASSTQNSTDSSIDTADKTGNDSASLDTSITQVFNIAAADVLNATNNIPAAEVHNFRLSFSTDVMDQLAADGAMVNPSVQTLKSGSQEPNIIELPIASEADDSTISKSTDDAVEQAGGEAAPNPVNNALNDADHTSEPIEICHDRTVLSANDAVDDEAGDIAVMNTTVQVIDHADLQLGTMKSTSELASDAALAPNDVFSPFPIEYDHDKTSDVEGLTKEGSEIVLNPDSETMESDGTDSSKEVQEVTYLRLQPNHALSVDDNLNTRLSPGANNTAVQLSTAEKIVAMEELTDSILRGSAARDHPRSQASFIHKALVQPTTAEKVAHISDKLKGFIVQGSSRYSKPAKEFTEFKPSPARKELGSFANFSRDRFSSPTFGRSSLLHRFHVYSSSDDSSGDEEVSLDSDSGSESDMDSELNHHDHHPAVLSHELPLHQAS